jgi:hypothetical protein
MINSGKCPHCDKVIQNLRVENLPIRQGIVGPEKWVGATLCCPLCHAILGASIDPIALKADIVNELLAKLRK